MCASGFYFVLGYSYLGLTAGDVYGSHSSMGQQQGGVDFTAGPCAAAVGGMGAVGALGDEAGRGPGLSSRGATRNARKAAAEKGEARASPRL